MLSALVAKFPGFVDIYDPERNWVIALFAILVHLRALYLASDEPRFASRPVAMGSAFAFDRVRSSVWLGAVIYCLSIWGAAIYSLTAVLS